MNYSHHVVSVKHPTCWIWEKTKTPESWGKLRMDGIPTQIHLYMDPIRLDPVQNSRSSQSHACSALFFVLLLPLRKEIIEEYFCIHLTLVQASSLWEFYCNTRSKQMIRISAAAYTFWNIYTFPHIL